MKGSDKILAVYIDESGIENRAGAIAITLFELNGLEMSILTNVKQPFLGTLDEFTGAFRGATDLKFRSLLPRKSWERVFDLHLFPSPLFSSVMFGHRPGKLPRCAQGIWRPGGRPDVQPQSR